MATKKIVLNGPFYLPNNKNRKYPQGIIPKDCQFDSDYLKNTFWKNEYFMSSIDATTSGDGAQFILRNHIASIGMNTNNMHRYNFDVDVLSLENMPKEEAIRLMLQLVNRNLLDRRKKNKEHMSMQCAKKQKLHMENSSSTNNQISIKSENKAITSTEAPLLNNVYKDICILNKTVSNDIACDTMLPSNIDFNHSPKANYEKKCEDYEMYSMIHNVFEDFNFCVYNGSHECSNQILHRSSVTNLYFPSDVGMFILFHGALVHSGAPSKMEKDVNSFNYSADVRFHAHVRRTGFVDDDIKNSSNRRSGRKPSLAKYINHATDASASSSIKHCSNVQEILKNKQREFKCEICKNALTVLQTRYPIVNKHVSINMSVLHKKAFESNPKHPMNKPLCVAGDLEKYGWVVCTGHQITKLRITEKRDSHEELMNFIHSGPTTAWRVPQKNRFVRTIDDNVHSIGKIENITKFYNHMLCDCLHKIPLFDKAMFTERYVIRNGGLALEQKPHRDFEYKVDKK